ncbi:hypothetical protein Tco_0649713 [Tanacetum coccineum]
MKNMEHETNVVRGTDKAKIPRKRLKPGKHEHGNGRARKKPGGSYQGQKVNLQSTWSTKVKDTLDDEKAQERWDFTLDTLSKEAQVVSITECQAGNPCEIRCDPTTKIALPIIERMYGQDWRSVYLPQGA